MANVQNTESEKPKKKGMMDKIKATKPYQMFEKLKTWRAYHFFMAFLSYLALGTMIASLSIADNPPEFNYPTLESDIKSATELNAGKPNNSPLFVKLAGVTGNEKMKNTKYIYATENGKASVRVCTDLSKKEFEEIVGIDERQEIRWDKLWYPGVQELYDANCVNASILAFNGGCEEEPIYSKKSATGRSARKGSYKRGDCGIPTVPAKLFANPRSNIPEGNGWLWHYMIKNKATIDPWPASETVNYRNCSSTECDVAKCYDKDCYDTSQTCNGWYETQRCGSNSNPENGTYRNSCSESVPKLTGFGYCDCGSNRKVYMCDSDFTFKCADTCKCVTPSLVTSPCSNTCNCTESKNVKRSEPDWILANPQYEKSNKVCHAAFGRFNMFPCEQSTVLSYGQQTQWIVNLFTGATVLRIIFQILCMYWGCTEDNLDYRILFACETFLRAYMVCKVGTAKINETEEKEYLQGWPWFIGLVDAILVSIATLGVAYGADPFPELGQGRFTLIVLWISAIREIGKLGSRLYGAYSKKAYYVRTKSHNVECCGKTIPWCYGSNAEDEKGEETELSAI